MEKAQIVAASAPIPRSARPTSAARNPMAVNSVTTVIAKSAQGQRQTVQGSVITTSARLASASRDNDIWLRAMILARSAASMTSTVFGESDMTILRSHFAKPQATVAMAFSEDLQQGPASDQFSGQAVVTLSTTPFMTASLR
jgi:hypothetical protein